MLSDVRGISVPRTSDVNDYITWLSAQHPGAWDAMVEAVDENGLEMDIVRFNPKQASVLIMSGLLKPIYFDHPDGYEFFDFHQWNPLKGLYQTWGTLDLYETDWFVHMAYDFFGWN